MSIESVLAENRLTRHAWAREEDGRQLLCLYTAMLDDPEARPEDCPASLCPRWLAYLLPWMDDAGTEAAWSAMVRRMATLAPHFHRLRPCVEWQVRAACVRQAMQDTVNKAVLAVCETVATLCERRGRDEHVSDEEIKKAERSVAKHAGSWSVGAVAFAEDPAAVCGAASRAAYYSAADRLTTTILDLIEADLTTTEVVQ